MQIGFRSIVSEDSPVQMGDTFTYESEESVWISYSGYTALARIPGLEVLQEYSNCDGSYSDTTLLTRTLAAMFFDSKGDGWWWSVTVLLM